MNIIIGGGSGFVGRALVPVLLASGHHVTVVGRDLAKIKDAFSSSVDAVSWEQLPQCQPDQFDAVINLTGANIAGKHWTEEYKQELLASRVNATRSFVTWCARGQARKPHLYNASAIGYYGLQYETPELLHGATESAVVDDKMDASFSGHLVRQWESAAQHADVPVTVMRFGVVLRRGEGMLKQLELPAKFGLGAVVGSGRQPLSWIDADDLVSAIIFLLEHPEVTGAINLTAPEFVSQKAFTKQLGEVLHRPSLLWLPEAVVKIMFGQMGEELLLSGQAVSPQRLNDLKFQFQYPTLQSALQHEFK